MQVPAGSITERTLPVIEQPVEDAFIVGHYAGAAAACPVLRAAVLPYATVDGVAIAVSAAWLALASVTVAADEVATL